MRFLSALFGGNAAPAAPPASPKSAPLPPTPIAEELRGQKRSRDEDGPTTPLRYAGTRTPTLVASRRVDHAERASKRLRGERTTVPMRFPMIPVESDDPQLQSQFLGTCPEEVVGHVLHFLGSTEDRFSLQCTCTQFRRISNTDEMLVNIKLGGDVETGKAGIIQEDDTPATTTAALSPFARAGNLEAIYMLGMIKSYCHQDVDKGIFLLKLASNRGYLRSSYALGLILRDSLPQESNKYMVRAAQSGYLPALQELLPAREMKAKYGEPDAEELRRHLDPVCLNRLLGRHYLHSSKLRDFSTSHCWNPLCGRWAFKASAISGGPGPLHIRPLSSFLWLRAPAANAPPPEARPQAESSNDAADDNHDAAQPPESSESRAIMDVRVSRMKMCSRCCRAKYCSKLCQVYDWRSGRHKIECQFL